MQNYRDIIQVLRSIDPMSEKYYHLSPYLWCAGNPIRFIDNDGKKLRFAQNSTSIFKENFSIAYNYLHEHGASYMIDEIIKSDKIYYLQETQEDSEFNPSTSTIEWNPYRALLTNSVYILTPSELLSHEFDHANSYDLDPEGTMKRLNEYDEVYGNKDDKRVIQTSEQDVAKRLGRLNDNQKTREDHWGSPYKVIGPDSDEIITPVVYGKKKNK